MRSAPHTSCCVVIGAWNARRGSQPTRRSRRWSPRQRSKLLYSRAWGVLKGECGAAGRGTDSVGVLCVRGCNHDYLVRQTRTDPGGGAPPEPNGLNNPSEHFGRGITGSVGLCWRAPPSPAARGGGAQARACCGWALASTSAAIEASHSRRPMRALESKSRNVNQNCEASAVCEAGAVLLQFAA